MERKVVDFRRRMETRGPPTETPLSAASGDEAVGFVVGAFHSKVPQDALKL